MVNIQYTIAALSDPFGSGADYLNLGTGLLWFFPLHTRGHYAQMGAALEAARKG